MNAMRNARGGTVDEWVAVANQVLAGGLDDADGTMRESLIIGLRGLSHPACREAWARLTEASTAPQPVKRRAGGAAVRSRR